MSFYIALNQPMKASHQPIIVHPTLFEADDDDDARQQAKMLRGKLQDLHLVTATREVPLPASPER